MSRAFYLSLKSTNKPVVIYIHENMHNPAGCIETPSGKVLKLSERNLTCKKKA